MANLKHINDLPVAESADGLNLIVNDNGCAKQIPVSEVGGSGGSADGLVIVTLSQETMTLSHTPAEITSLLQAGKMVLCNATHASFVCNIDGSTATTMALANIYDQICIISYTFDEHGVMSSTKMYYVSVTEGQ